MEGHPSPLFRLSLPQKYGLPGFTAHAAAAIVFLECGPSTKPPIQGAGMINSGTVEVQEPEFAIRELDHRRSDGIEVTLLWNTRTSEVVVAVSERDGGRFEFAAHPAEALEAFHHPYAYAACDARPIPPRRVNVARQ
jgi:hypothetical protein